MISSGTTQQSSAPYNRRIVLDLIRRAGEISRKEIVERISLSPQTVANITQELVSTGVVIARRKKTGKSRGQPPIVFVLNPEGGMSIGISLEPGTVSAALVNLAGEILDRERREIDANNPELCLGGMLEMVSRLEKGVTPGTTVWGIGVSLPGPFNSEELSFVGPTVFEGWSGLEVLEKLNRESGHNVCYSTDSIAGALGESLYGAATRLQNFFYVHVGVGLGGVLVTGAAAYQGANGNATEFGHIPVSPGGKPCHCGNLGCLERYVSLHALAEYFTEQGMDPPAAEQIHRLVEDSDPVMQAWCDQASEHFRNAVCFIENTLDPESIIVGGSTPRALVEKLIEGAKPWSHSVREGAGEDRTRVMPARYQEESAILGAAVLPIHEMTAPRMEVLHRQESRKQVTETLFGRNVRPEVGRL